MNKEQKQDLDEAIGAIGAHGIHVEVFGSRIVLVDESKELLKKLHEARGTQDVISVLTGIEIGLGLARAAK